MPTLTQQRDYGSHPQALWITAMISAIIVAHIELLPLITTDVVTDFVPWYENIVRAGPAKAFAAPFGAYNPPYLYLLALMTPLHGLIADEYLIKLLNVFGSVLLALSVSRLARALDITEHWRVALNVFCLPTVLLNSALIGQCDAIYVAPIMMGMAACVRQKHIAMLAWFGLAFAIKPQAVFIAPFVLAILLARRVPLLHWLAAPAVFIATLLPAWAAGWPAYDLLMINLRQVETSTAISRNAPNIWMIVTSIGPVQDVMSKVATILVIAATGAYVLWARIGLRVAAPAVLLRFAILSVLLTVGLMPRMHERYFIIADVLAILLLGLDRTRNAMAIAALVPLGSLLGILAYAMGVEALAAIGAVPMILATFLTVRWLAARKYNIPSILHS